eukprot:1483694-Amphidinium_carterae.1
MVGTLCFKTFAGLNVMRVFFANGVPLHSALPQLVELWDAHSFQNLGSQREVALWRFVQSKGVSGPEFVSVWKSTCEPAIASGRATERCERSQCVGTIAVQIAIQKLIGCVQVSKRLNPGSSLTLLHPACHGVLGIREWGRFSRHVPHSYR